MVKKVIFDLDNTLVSNVDFNLPVAYAFDDLSIPYEMEDVLNIQKAIGEYEHKTSYYNKELMLKYFREYTGLNLDMEFLDVFFLELEHAVPNELEDGIIDTLEYLYEKYKLCVLTNWFEREQAMRLKNSGIIDFFEYVYGGETFKKPDRRSYLMACNGLNPNEAIMIGDSLEFDYKGAKNAGLESILLDKNNIYPEIEEKINNIKELKLIL